MQNDKRNPRHGQDADLHAGDDLDARLLEMIMRLERVRSKALNAVETILTPR